MVQSILSMLLIMWTWKVMHQFGFKALWVFLLLAESATLISDPFEGSADLPMQSETDLGWCSEGTYASYHGCLECTTGHFCPGNMSAPHKCPLGTFNFYTGRSSVGDCKPCSPGLISSEDRADCSPCPAGFSCHPANGTLSACPEGQHSPEGIVLCLACPIGSVCPSGHPQKCDPGGEADSEQTACVDCPPGFFSTPCTVRCVKCPSGTHCPENGTSQPLPCPLGQTSSPGQALCHRCNDSSPQCGGAAAVPSPWSNTAQRSGQALVCRPGTYKDPRGGPACLFCPLGHYCAVGEAAPCPGGTYGPKEGMARLTDCPACPAGFYCMEGSTERPTSQFLCPPGFYCEEGTPNGTPCPPGTAGQQLGQTSRAACKRCGEGRFCPAGSVNPGLACARGRYCPAGTIEEMVCPQGTFTPHQGAISVKDCLRCPGGFYCPEGTRDPLPCPPGSFNPLQGQDELTDCRPCYPGKACTQVALKAPDVACMQGFVCPPGSSKPNALTNACPPGTLSNRTDLTDRSQCQPCPARYACPRGTGGLQRPPVSCFAGHYCPAGTMFPTQYKCPVGTWSGRSGLETEAGCGPCLPGWYCLAGAGAPSGRCSSGHFCPEGTVYGTQFPCPAGTYSIRLGNRQPEDCLECPEGSFCLQGTSKPSPCPPSTFRRLKGGQQIEDCSACPAGYFCPRSATVSPGVCGTGSYSDEGSERCAPCLRGHYCSSEATSEEAMLSMMVCPAGFLCSQGLARDPQRSATLCPQGFYCPGGGIDPNPVPCPSGTYSGSPGLRDVNECVQCPPGKYCYSQNPQQKPINEPSGPCPDGHFCPQGTGDPYTFPCQAGHFRNNTLGHSGEACVPCPSRHYCLRPGTQLPEICPQGFYCPEGSSDPQPCPGGSYGSRPALIDRSECTSCGGGRYCMGVGLSEPSGDCTEGFYCREGATSTTPVDGATGGLCPVGSYCPPASTSPSPCPPGRYSSSAGMGRPEHCTPCPPGFYCSGFNSSAPSGPCAAGHYCTGGSASPTQHQAEKGSYSPKGASRPEPCPPGTFQAGRGGRACVACPGGRLCDQTGLSQTSPCPPGHYCPPGATVARPCPPGTYSDLPGGVEVQHCHLCDAGWFCGQEGLSHPQGLCDPGHFCTAGAATASPVGMPSGDVCPMGYFCPGATMHPQQHPCPVGTWGDTLGAQDLSSCVPCPPGRYCSSTGLSRPSGDCRLGYYCTGGAESPAPSDGVTGHRCPVGHRCPAGSSAAEPCPDGTHSNSTGAAVCAHCPPGTYCLSGEGLQPCPAGHYCLGGSVEGILPCPPGTYSPQLGLSQVEQCLICPAGRFCDDWGLFEPTGLCAAGYYCLAGINFRNPDGNFSMGVGGACPLGMYCPEGTGRPLPCPRGTYSHRFHLTERSGCVPCPGGQYCGAEGLTRPSGPCREGFFCSGGDTTHTGADGDVGLCPSAHHCPGGSARPLPCPAGSYTNLRGQTSCSRCPAGYFCPEKTGNFTSFPCPPGYYCPDGTRHATQFPCPRGYYNPESMTQSLDSCLPCPPGHYCEKERLTKVSGKCKGGWFCVSAAWNSQPFDLDNYTNANCLCPATSTGGRCQAGFYCPSGSTEPLSCPPGAFCNVSGLALPRGPCAAGFYCVGGAIKAKPTDGVTGSVCPPGTYCVEGSGEPEPCPAGTFSPAPGLASEAGCLPCSGGFYCREPGLTAPTAPCSQGFWCPPGQRQAMALPCPQGHYCPRGSAAPQPCPSGNYQDLEKQAGCKVCQAGYYCDLSLGLANVSVVRPCPKGHYCPAGTSFSTQNPCPIGSFNPRERTDSPTGCLPCPPGQYCPAVGLAMPAGPCLGGFWCRKGAVTASPLDGISGVLCPPGQYCYAGTPAPVACPAGSWSNSSGVRSQGDCRPCPAGYYCNSAGLTGPMGLCGGGYFCVEGAVTSTPADGATGGSCPLGHYCPAGAGRPVPCPPGTYGAATHATECQPCNAGWYCVSGSQQLCPAGFYCPAGWGHDPPGCPEGTYSGEPGLQSVSQCRPCQGGHYCSSTNSSGVTGRCRGGYYCTQANTSPTPLSRGPGEGGPCPPGFYCPRASVQPLPCPTGTFSNRSKLVAQEACQLCPAGLYCDREALTAPAGECRQGFYCVSGSERPDPPTRDARGGPCPRGYYCSEGLAVPRRCPRGTISEEEGGASCSPCPDGFYCPRSNDSLSERYECPAGHYCPAGTWSRHQYPCPAGSINPRPGTARPQTCTPCPPGLFCRAPGQSAASDQCSAGYYCVSGASSPTPEDGGLTGHKCPEGHYCPRGSWAPLPCPQGHYSAAAGNTGLSDCLPCPAGFLCTSRGLSSPSDGCPAGAYCPRLGNASLQLQQISCSPGYRCPPGSASQMPCLPGTYQSLPGQAECSVCPAGSYCPGSVDEVTGDMSGTHTPLPCPKGHYCPPGAQSGVAFPCPAGSFNVRTGVSSRGGCEPCPPGKYCSAAGLAAPTGLCSPGYLCIQASVTPQPGGGPTGGRCSRGSYCSAGARHMAPCPPGTFSPLEGATSVAACQPCRPGHYCGEAGLSRPSGPCNPGFYCSQGSTTPAPRGDTAGGRGNTTSPSRPLGNATAGHLHGDVCPVGHYCPNGTAAPRPCPPGTFQGRFGAASQGDCTPCSPGSYCPSWAQPSAQHLCPQGWFCPPGSLSDHPPDCKCPSGHACPPGSAEPAVCSPGTFQASAGQSTCEACPPGFYCMEGAWLPTPCPPGSVSPLPYQTAPGDCSLCPSGSFCNNGGLTQPSGPCSPGHFCTQGASEASPVSKPYGDLCPKGHFCPEGSASPKPCPVGSYLRQTGASSPTHCLPCPPGDYCLAAGAPQPTGACLAGFYCFGGADSPTPRANPSLFSCLIGALADNTTVLGSYLWTRNHSCFNSPDVCGPAGWGNESMQSMRDSDLLSSQLMLCLKASARSSITHKGDICPRGFYCPPGSARPLPCDAGSYCNTTGLAAPGGLCGAGYHCTRGSTDPHALPCPTGHYCPPGSPQPLPCPVGTIKDSLGGFTTEACRPCPPGLYCARPALTKPTGQCTEGHFCPEGQTTGTPKQHVCQPGHHCEKGSVRETACQPGRYQPREGQGSCETCPAGSYCPDQGTTLPVGCERGYYCIPGSEKQSSCPAGTYSNQSGLMDESHCLRCDPGMFCKEAGRTSPSGPCAVGYLCTGGASEASPADRLTGGPCPTGSFCPLGTTAPEPCPKGTFSERVGLVNASQCRLCDPGSFCSQTGLSAVSGPCLPGFYCLEGSHSATPTLGKVGGLCPMGHYCPLATSVPAACPPGTYLDASGGREMQECKPCQHGWYQDSSGQKECKPCPPGFLCHNPRANLTRASPRGASSPQPCPAGYTCSGDRPDAQSRPCPAGTYSPRQGLTAFGECLACPAGRFCGAEGLVEPSGPCSDGFLCLLGATVPNPSDHRTGSPCPPGVFCRQGSIAGECWAGYYCDGGSMRADRALCPAGSFCPRGTAAPLPCPAGTFSAARGNTHQDNCSTCPAGCHCQGEGTVQPVPCPRGHYCPAGLVLGVEFPCPPGTVQDQPGASSLDACLPCPPGMFCSLPGLSQPSGLCKAGYVCPAGSTSPNLTQGNSSAIHLCPPGHYCIAGSGSPLPCPVGTLSPSPGQRGVEGCTPCPPGLFCDRPALADPSGAQPCHAGYVCKGGSSSPKPTDGHRGYLCPPGHSCPAGCAEETPCEAGSYSPTAGRDRCIPCLDGTACPSVATRTPSVCPPGHFCPVGTVLPLACPAGTLSRQTGAGSAAVCVPCPPGAYCSSPGASAPDGPCQQGFFCHSGSVHPAPQSSFPRNGPCPSGYYCPAGCLSPVPCPLGSIRNTTGGVSMEGCSACPSGSYCSAEGLSSPTGPCSAGFYCPFDFSSTTPYAFLCPKGHYCPVGSPLALPCPTGGYQPNAGSESCIPCRPGYYCEEAIVGDSLPCPPHSFCPAGTMVPHHCPAGTHTMPEQGGLQSERECLPCPPGSFCRAGRIQGQCAAGYVCASGSADYTPQSSEWSWNHCEWGVQCAGLCPPGFYCPEGTERPQVCPPNTMRHAPGGASLQDCVACPPHYWCIPGDPELHLCPAGHYCNGLEGGHGRGGPQECPAYTYRATPGAGARSHCHPCPPGSYCNTTGLTDYTSHPCPPGHWCSGEGPPIVCPAGTQRSHHGAAAPSQCEPCDGGTFCPDPQANGRPNVWGIPCRPAYHCPPGAVSESRCRAGSFCGAQTAEPSVCPRGYFCPEGSHSYSTPQQLCRFPFYCPANSSAPRSCEGGSAPVNTSGLRGSNSSCCRVCDGGTYRLHSSPTPHCLPCPPGYYCPQGAESYHGNPCPLGHVCPAGSPRPLLCPPGSFGNLSRAGRGEQCHACPAGTFNHLPAQQACFPCGSSSSSSLEGSASCTCMGKNRAFQHSDGSCLCRTGFVFYNQLDFKSSSADSQADCQPEVNMRCAAGQVRLAASRECVSPSLYPCNATCGPHGGTVDAETGICQCERYVSSEELCNSSCVARLPQLFARLSADGQLILSLKQMDSRLWVRNGRDILGPDVHLKNIGKVHVVQFGPDGVFGWIFTDRTLINQFLSDEGELLHNKDRSKRDTETKGTQSSATLPRIPNPIGCLSSGDMIVFQLTINHTDRSLSHFPVYHKDHLFNSNPGWDFGAFRRLQVLLKHTHFNSTRFAHVFSETGKYVLVDSAVPERSVVVVVSDRGTQCDPRAAVFQPQTPAQLVRFGILKQHRVNLLPDWGVIVAVLSLLLLLVVVLTSIALVLRPSKAKLILQWRNKPRWRSLGEPCCPVEYLPQGDSLPATLNCADLLGNRGVGEGAEAEEPAVSKGGASERFDLEEFNVKTLYDKLEDQNLHLASQLARHRKDTQEFYRNMCQQADSLQNILENMDEKKLSLLKELGLDSMKRKLCTDAGEEREKQADASVALLGAVLGSVEALIMRLTGEGWQNQDLPSPPHCLDNNECEEYGQNSEAHVCEPQSSPMNLTKIGGPHQDSGHSLSDQDLSKLVAITPLSRTLQEIQQSLQNLTSAGPVVNNQAVIEDQPLQPIPVALDNLPPQHSAIFLFGCQVMRLLSKCPLFPPVLLLIAKSIPVSPWSTPGGLLAHCSGDFHFDTSNQILYLSEAKLQHVGQFISTILQAMAYVASGSRPQVFMQALHQAISALSLQLFKVSFKLDQMVSFQPEDSEAPQTSQHGSLPNDFLNVSVPYEEHFSDVLLASRLQKYKFFKLEQLISDLKHGPRTAKQRKMSLSPEGTPAQVSSIEEEIDRLNESFLHLSLQMQKRGQMHTQRWESQHTSTDHAARPAGTELPALSCNGTILVELQRRYVSQKLDELQIKLEQSRPCQRHDSPSQDGPKKSPTATDSYDARQGQGGHIASPENPQNHDDEGALSECRWQDTAPTDRSQSQQSVVAKSGHGGNDLLEGHVSDQKA